eukprot:782982-Pleurochrysis_carterae.AAC.2
MVWKMNSWPMAEQTDMTTMWCITSGLATMYLKTCRQRDKKYVLLRWGGEHETGRKCRPERALARVRSGDERALLRTAAAAAPFLCVPRCACLAAFCPNFLTARACTISSVTRRPAAVKADEKKLAYIIIVIEPTLYLQARGGGDGENGGALVDERSGWRGVKSTRTRQEGASFVCDRIEEYA